MYRMNNLVEILLGLVLIFLVVGQPKFLRHHTRSTMGKIIFLTATILAGFRSLYAGILVALIYIILRRDYMLVEGMENENESDSDTDESDESESDDESKEQMTKPDFVKKYCKDGNVDKSLNPPTLKYSGEKCNPCDVDCEFEVTSAHEQLTVDEALRPKDSKEIPVQM